MKSIYSFFVVMMVLAQGAYAQQTTTTTTTTTTTPPPTTNTMPVLLQTGGLPGIGTTLNQDYNSVGINPANLGMVTSGKPVVTFGLIGLDAGVTTNAVGFSSLKQFFSDSIPYQQVLANGFANHGATVGLDIMPVGISVQIPKIGGFAFTVQDKFIMNMYMNPTFASIVFNGFNSSYFTSVVEDSGQKEGVTNNPQSISQAFNGSYIKGSFTQTYALSYGTRILKIGDNSLYIGGSLKYVKGFAFANGYIDANGNLVGFLSYSTTFSNLGDSAVAKPNPVTMATTGPATAGTGEAFDLGATLAIGDNIRVGASVTDVTLSDIDWSGVTYEVINSYVDSLKKYAGVGSLLKGGLKSTLVFEHPSSFKEPMPTQFHLGGSIFLIKKFEVAADIDAPLNSVGGNIEDPIFTLSGGYVVGNALRVTLGFQHSAYTSISIPIGIVIGTGKNATWQWGVSYADLTNLFRSNSVSLGGSFFFLRFRIL